MGDRAIHLLSRPETWVALLGLAGLLGLTSWLRGAPPGRPIADEPDEDAPTAARRERLVLATAAGVSLIGIGAFLATTLGIPWSIPAFAAGFGLLIALIRSNRRLQHASPTVRRLVTASESVLLASLLGGVLVIGNLLAFRLGGRPIDFTRERAFSLSSLTTNAIRSLDRPVRFVAIASDLRMPRVLQLLERYRAEDPSKITLERIDPYADPVGFEEAARRSPDLAINPRGGAVVIEYGEGDSADRLVVRSADLFDVRELEASSSRRDAVGTLFQGEDAITSALIRLMDGEKPTILFTSGHGEPSIRALGPGQPGLGMLAARLSALGARVAEMPPGRVEIPPGTSLVIVGGPQAAWPAEDVARLREYANRGGRVIVFLDNQAPTNFDDWLREHNVKLGAGVAVDLRYNDERRPNIVAAPIGPEDRHPIVASLANRAILMASAAPLVTLTPSPGAAGAEPANPAMVAVPFLRSSPGSWAETTPDVRPLARDEGRDTPGPLDLAVAVSDRSRRAGDAPTPRLVVFGSRFVADNAFVSRDPANLDVVINSVQWLRDRPDLQGIAPKTQLALSLDADPALRTKLVLIPTLIAITILGALGVLVFLLRRE